MNLSEENKKNLKNELLKLKLKNINTPQEKHRIQTLQQILFRDQ